MIVSVWSGSVDLNDPTTVALLAVEAFGTAGHRYALYGGLLTAVYGEPRETRDADLAVVDVSVDLALQALTSDHLHLTVAFRDVRFGGLTVSRLTLTGKRRDGTPESGSAFGLNTIDLVRPRSARYADLAIERAAGTTLRDRPVRLLTLEDFVLFKLLSTRDRDLEDARAALVRSAAALDRTLLTEEIDRLSSELPDVSVAERWSAVASSV